MDIKQLRYFVQVYENGSFAAAAKRNFISPQGLSMSILRLEEELSCQLFTRTPTGIELTEEGRYLLPRAQNLVDKMDDLESYYKSQDKRKIPVRVVGAYGTIPEIAGGLLQKFERRYPQYTIVAEELSDTDCDNAVEQGRYELGFGVGPFRDAAFESWPLITVKSCLLVNKNHPFAELSGITVDALRDLPVMTMNSKFKATMNLKRVCADRGFEPKISFGFSEASAILRMVAQDLGVGITIQSVAESFHHPDVVAIPFEEPEMNWSIHMFKRRGRVLSPGGQELEKYVTRRFPGGGSPAAQLHSGRRENP